MPRRWIKLWVAESLRGTIRFDFTPAERGVWYDLLALAGDCRQDGLIAPGSDQAYPLRWIAGTLNISTSLLQKTLEKCKTCSRIEVNGSGIRVLNWNKYQSEYERQKPFREAKTLEKGYNKVTDKVTSGVTQRLPVEGEGEGEGDIDIEGDVEVKKKDSTKKPYGEFQNVLLADKDYKKLIDRFGKDKAIEWIETLSTGIKSKGYKYKSHYAAILTWERREKIKGKGAQGEINKANPRRLLSTEELVAENERYIREHGG